MNKKQRAEIILKILNKYFKNPKISLKHKTPYTLLIATILSCQSTDKIVNKISPILFKKAPSLEKMSTLSIKELEKIIKPCGLFSTKAKNILKLSKILLKNYNSKIPKTFQELEKLPGVGRKTASVVLAFAFNKDTFPIDTHIKRCAKRWKLSNKTKIIDIEKDLKKIFPKKYWRKLHLQIIYFARKFCKAKKHEITKCPICSILK